MKSLISPIVSLTFFVSLSHLVSFMFVSRFVHVLFHFISLLMLTLIMLYLARSRSPSLLPLPLPISFRFFPNDIRPLIAHRLAIVTNDHHHHHAVPSIPLHTQLCHVLFTIQSHSSRLRYSLMTMPSKRKNELIHCIVVVCY